MRALLLAISLSLTAAPFALTSQEPPCNPAIQACE